MILFLRIRKVRLLDLWGFGMKKNDRVFSTPPTARNKKKPGFSAARAP
jgi:hypothetical protein